MCLIVFAYECHPRYRLLLAANRDEYYDRPSAPADYWPENQEVMAGRDLLKGGTWLGLTKTGRLAALTNYRDPSRHRPEARSRGELVSDFLLGTFSPEAYLSEIKIKSRLYNGFALLTGDNSSLWYYSNMERKAQQVKPGIHGLSNHLLDTPWFKVRKAKRGLSALLNNDLMDPAWLFSLLAAEAAPPDTDLPHTGVGLDWERILSPIFIQSPAYGTRSSSVLLIEHNNNVYFAERTFTPGRKDWREVSFRHQPT